jgi:hypothetical protein
MTTSPLKTFCDTIVRVARNLLPATNDFDDRSFPFGGGNPNEIHATERKFAINVETELGQKPRLARFRVGNSKGDMMHLHFTKQSVTCQADPLFATAC